MGFSRLVNVLGGVNGVVMSRPTEKVPGSARPGEGAPVSAGGSISGIVGDTILGSADVSQARERRRLARLRRLVAVAALVLGWVVIRRISGHGVFPSLHLPHGLGTVIPILLIICMLGTVMLAPLLFAGPVSAHTHPSG